MDNHDVLKNLQRVELEMFKAFVSVCEQLELNYYLIGGTLLGAVRHKGFIPWDDDIDVGMPREDYEKFAKYAQAYLPEYYFIQTRETDPEFPLCFMKIRDSRTTFVESSVRELKINHGIYIDIFPLELHPEKKLGRFLFNFFHRLLNRRILCVFSLPAPQNSGLLKKIKHTIVTFSLYILFPNVKTAISLKEKLHKSVCKSSLIGNHSGAWGNKEIVPVEWFGNGETLLFEEIFVRVPSQYDKWLSQVYGDYMLPPPLEKRQPHHYTDLIDFDNPYTLYYNK